MLSCGCPIQSNVARLPKVDAFRRSEYLHSFPPQLVRHLLSPEAQYPSFHKVSAKVTATMADVPLRVVSENTSSERRITPSWSISRLKAKLETVTGIPPSSQKLFLKPSAQESIPIEASDEDSTYLTSFPLVAYTELHVSDTFLSLTSHQFSLLTVTSSEHTHRVTNCWSPRSGSGSGAELTGLTGARSSTPRRPAKLYRRHWR